MASYAVVGGKKVLVHDDGSTSDVIVIVPLDGGVTTKLTDTQLATLTPPDPPTEYPLPAAQLAALTPPAPPTEYPLPAAQLAVLAPLDPPAEYPWTATQAGYVTAMRDRLLAFDRGAGDYGTNTLRVILPSNQPVIPAQTPDATQVAIATTGSGVKTIATPASGKKLRISALVLQAATPTKIQLRAGTTNISGVIEIVSFEHTYSEPIVLAANVALNINVDTTTPNALSGYLVYREV